LKVKCWIKSCSFATSIAFFKQQTTLEQENRQKPSSPSLSAATQETIRLAGLRTTFAMVQIKELYPPQALVLTVFQPKFIFSV
jgi:hypothetical protein